MTVLDTDGLVAVLRAQSQRYHHRHPFHQKMNAGGLSPEQIRGWAANRFYYQVNLPRKDAAILANCPERDVRRRWIQRILDHDGTADAPGGIDTWLLLAESMGMTRAEVLDERHVVPGVRFAVDAYVTFARTRPWTEAVASSLTELFAPDLDRPAGAGLLPGPPEPGAARLRARPGGGDALLPDTGAAGRRRGGAVLQVRRAVEHARRHRAGLCRPVTATAAPGWPSMCG
jgi:pyrroloquinoline quinone (PQQ) biosynthesis protein C